MSKKSLSLQELSMYSVDNIKEMESENLVKITKKFIEKTLRQIGEVNKDKEYIFLLGNTGSGKSTIINYLTGEKAQIIKGKLKNFLKFKGKNALRVENGIESCTFLPKIKEAENRTYIDVAGFKDNRGFFVNLSSAILFNELISKLSKVKICFVVDYAAIKSEKGGQFVTFFKENIFPIISEDFRSKITLIINNVDSGLTIVNIHDAIKEIIVGDDPSITNFFHTLVDEERISIFSSPEITVSENDLFENEAQVNAIKLMLDEKNLGFEGSKINTGPLNQEILKIIFNAYTETIKFEDEKILKEYTDAFYKISCSQEKADFNKKILRNIRKIDTTKKLRGYDNLKAKIDLLGKDNSFESMEKIIPFMANNGPIDTIEKKANNALEELSKNLTKFQGACTESGIKKVTSTHGSEFRIFGNFINVNAKDFKNLKGNIKNVKLFATNYIIIDSSFSLHGINLTIVAPNLSIEGQITIDLSGQNAINHEPQKADLGKKGLPGGAGKSSGNLFVAVNKGYQIKNLNLRLLGGLGSNGQDGGDGAPGKDGKNAIDLLKEHYRNMNTAIESQSISGEFPNELIAQHVLRNRDSWENSLMNDSIVDKPLEINTKRCCCCCIPKYKVKKFEFNVFGTEATDGENGLVGGAAGHNGKDGKLISFGIKSKDIVLVTDATKSKSENGKNGEGGASAKHGESCQVVIRDPENYYKPSSCGIIEIASCGLVPLFKAIASSTKPDIIPPKLKTKGNGWSSKGKKLSNTDYNTDLQEKAAKIAAPEIKDIRQEYLNFLNDLEKDPHYFQPQDYFDMLKEEFIPGLFGVADE